MTAENWLGWGASAILLATLLRQVFVQWRERSTDGVSSWLFVGQITASCGFVAYSWLVGNRVFVVTNTAILLTAIVGQLIYRRNARLADAADRTPAPDAAAGGSPLPDGATGDASRPG